MKSLLCSVVASAFLATTAAAEIPDYDSWREKKLYGGNPIIYTNPENPSERVKVFLGKREDILYRAEVYLTQPETYYERNPCPERKPCFHFGEVELGIVLSPELEGKEVVEDIRLSVLNYFRNLYELKNPEDIRIRFRSF